MLRTCMNDWWTFRVKTIVSVIVMKPYIKSTSKKVTCNDGAQDRTK